MKIVRIITRLNAGGPTWQAEFLSRALAERGHETFLVHGDLGQGEAPAPAAWRLAPRRIEVPALGRRIDPARDTAAFLAILALVRRERPDVVHTHHAKAGALGRLAAWMAGVPAVVHTFHGNVLSGYFPPAGSRLVTGIERFLGRLSSALIAVSPAQRRDLVGRFRIASGRKVAVVPLGTDLAPFREAGFDPALKEALGLPRAAPVVGIVARLEPVKDVASFLEAARLASGRRPDARFLVVGDGPLRGELEGAARSFGIADRVRFLGMRDDVARLYPLMDVVCLTSRNEGTPLSLIEAMAAGRATVACAVGGVPDLVADGRTGILVPPGEPERFAEAVGGLLADPARRESLGAAARVAAGPYDARRLVGDILELYRSLLLPSAPAADHRSGLARRRRDAPDPIIRMGS